MLPNSGFESVLRREIDSLPLPPEAEWMPSSTGPASGPLWATGGVLLIVAAVIGGNAAREWRQAAQPEAGSPATVSSTPRVGPTALPTVVDGRGVAPVPIVARHPELGFNLVLPGDWRRAEDLWRVLYREYPLVGRVSYTARSPAEQAELLKRLGNRDAAELPWELPWDVSIAIWSNDGITAEQFARLRGGCGPTCTVSSTVIKSTTFLTTVDAVTGRHAFYAQRPNGLLVVSYIVGSAADQPTGVSSQTLENIVRSIGSP
jgi:hypothetical protein